MKNDPQLQTNYYIKRNTSEKDRIINLCRMKTHVILQKKT